MINDSKFKTKAEIEGVINNLIRVKSVYYEKLISAYRDRVKKYYLDELNANKDGFRLLNTVGIHLYLTNLTVYEIIYKSNQDNFNCSIQMDLRDYNGEIEFKSLPEKEKYRQIKERIDIQVEDILILEESTYDRIEYKIENQSYLEKLAIDNGNSIADSDSVELDIQRYIKGIRKDINQFKLYSTKDTIAKVGIEQFADEFTECVLCYENEFYLASALVGFVCIETILKELIRVRLGKGKLPEQSYMIKSAQVLIDSGIITQKSFKRIQAVNSLRHAIAHTSTGSIKQWDTEQILVAIKLLVEEYF